MDRRESLFLAKKLFHELVFNTAYIEGVNVTFPDTQTILDGGIVSNIRSSDIQTVFNLRDGWHFVINTLDEPITLDYICKVNAYVSKNESLEWGVLRKGNVGISGTDYVPPIPTTEDVCARLNEINEIADPLDKALTYFCYAVRGQLFWDGNKRTSTMISSKILVENGIGVMTIDPRHAQAFNESLLYYYNSNQSQSLRAVLSDCIKSLEPIQKTVAEKLSAAMEQQAKHRESPLSTPDTYEQGR